MDGENNVVDSKSEDFGRLGVEDFRNALNLKVVVARSQRAHLAALSFLGALRHVFGLRPRHPARFLDALEVAGLAPPALDGPTGASRQHCIHLNRIERDRARAADAGRDLAEQRVGKRLLHRKNVGNLEAGQHGAYAA